jgi:uncharacterized membrane protein (UPF0127 family)
MRTMISRRTAFLLSLVVLAAGSVSANAQTRFEKLTIVAASGRHEFQVEVMENEEQRARGLMFRREMAADRGMLFDFKQVQPVAFWMKNTYIPLDMIFIDERGEIVNIAENTEPLSERSVPSGKPVLGVLEVNAGISRKFGFKAGDRVEHRIFRK